MDRRQFLIRAGGIASIPAAGGIVRAQVSNQGPALVEAELEARESWSTIDGRPAQLYAYNGQMPGPIIEARAGSSQTDWRVRTDRGEVSFATTTEESVRAQGEQAVLITDTRGIRYLIPDRRELDLESQKILRRFL